MSEQTVITPSTFDESEDPRPVRIQYGDVRMRLPRLDDSTQLPLAMISAGIMIVSKGWNNLTQEEKLNFMGVILAYLIREYPLLEVEMDRKSGNKLKDLGLIIQAWAKAGHTDPKPDPHRPVAGPPGRPPIRLAPGMGRPARPENPVIA